MAANLTPIVAVQPYNGQRLSQSPQDLVITFNQPYVPFLMGSFDVQLEEVNRDGTMTPVWNAGTAPIEETDGTGTELIIPVQELNQTDYVSQNLTLQPGHYEIELLGDTSISYFASGAMGPGPQLWDPTQSYVIGGFTVLGTGATLSGATNLGTINSFAPTVTGYLNPDIYQSAVHLYEFNLAQGHFWEVGLSVSAKSIGSGLQPALTLFDAEGDVLATRDSGTGLPSDPIDPYLITGLAPGTYYVGVSGAGNLPNVSGGFDPVLGIPGQAGSPQPNGPFEFQLGLAAEPHNQSTSLVNFTVDRADLLNPSPTGLTLTFNGPVDLSKLFLPDTQETALEVVNSSGQVWPITAETYEVTDARLTVLFDQPLPAGQYSLVIPSQGGLTDLAGLPLSAPGEPSGVLATWNVAAATGPRVPGNLGVLWPATANLNDPTSSLARPFSVTTDLGPGQNETYRFVVTVPGFYKLQTQVGSGAVAIENFGSGWSTILEPGTGHQLNNYLMDLGDGVYGLRFINSGSQPAVVQWALKISSLDWEKIVDNGVGQTSALSLMLFSPTPSDPEGSSIASFQAIAGSGAGSASAGSSGPITASLFVSLNTGLIGQPTPMGQSVAPVGPTVETGSIAVADSTTGLQPGIRYESMSVSGPTPGDGVRLGQAEPTGVGTVADDPAIRLAAGGALQHHRDPEANSTRADERALAQSEWLVRLGSRIKNWLVPMPAASEINASTAASIEAQAMARNDAATGARDSAGSDRNKRPTASAQADIGAGAGLVIAGAMVFRLRQPIQKWWRRRDWLTSARPAPARPFRQGPHSVSTRARAMARARTVYSPR